MFLVRLTILLVLVCGTACVGAFAASIVDFHPLVSGLSSDSDATRASRVAQLQQIPDLDAQLVKDLKSPKPQPALKVIRALQRTSVLDPVIALAKSHPTTEVYETLRALLNPQTQDPISSLVSQQLSSSPKQMSSGAIIHGLEILSQASVLLPVADAEYFLQGKSYEVRIALVAYIRTLVKRDKAQPFLPLISEALVSNPYQLRLEATETAEQLPKAQLSTLSNALKKCSSDQNSEVQQKCKSLVANREGP